jgi:predicted ABC-type ATPase
VIVKLVLLLKAQRRGDLIPIKKQITRGGKSFMQTVWVSPQDAAKMGSGAKVENKPAGLSIGQKFGMHNIEAGDKVTFEMPGGKTMSGRVESAGKDGVMVNGQAIYWKDIRGFSPKKGTKKPEYNERYFNKKKDFIEPENFIAAQWKKQFDDEKATPESVLNSFEGKDKIIKAIADTEERLERLEQTINWYRKEGKDEAATYSATREKIHGRIIDSILSPRKIEEAKPSNGERPKFIMLGGRGGSGKSWFEGNVYDPQKFIVLDADVIKGMLPEYEGWNAAQVHEESSDILEGIIKMARDKGLNVVLDATMKTATSAIAKMRAFKNKGYTIEAHYMHLPRQEAAKRAVSRFMGKTKRYVPINVVLSNISNEETFDLIKAEADNWSFRDNNVPKGKEPIVISEKKR